MAIRRALLLWLLVIASALRGDRPGDASRPFARFDTARASWTLGNEQVAADFQLTSEGNFRFLRLDSFAAGEEWRAPAGAPVAPFGFVVDGRLLDAAERYRLVSQSASWVERGGLRQTIVLEHLELPIRIRFEAEVYPGQPFLRYRSWLENRGNRPVWVTEARMLNWKFADSGQSYRSFQVNQWVQAGRSGNFETIETAVAADGPPVEVYSGAHAQHCAWLVGRDGDDRGILFGWEFDGRALILLRHRKSDGELEIAGGPEGLFRQVGPGDEFLNPGAFVGVFHGDWDEASHRTHRFVEAVLALPAPDPQNFPYVMWDSWGYDQDINEETIRRAARVAARMGIEVIVLDLGWARAIGDWRADPAKFPSGLKALSDYVHSLGMKFGLHFAFTEASPEAPMLRLNPDWFANEDIGYFDARPLCLSHRPVREWIVAEGIRMIREYGVDWILTDGENMVKRCTKQTHTHHPADSNYSNAVDGLNAVVDQIQRATPDVLWENCQDGGNVMTFNMVKRFVTSIAADEYGPLWTRQAVYGVTYPFPPRYADRYMPDDNPDRYSAQSYMFGGPWIFMNRLAEWTERQITVGTAQIAVYKRLRPSIRNGRVYHLGPRPAASASDAIQSHDEASGASLIFVYREESPSTTQVVRPRGLHPEQLYRVIFEESPEQFLASGAMLMNSGIQVSLPAARSAEIVYIEPAVPAWAPTGPKSPTRRRF